MNSCPVKHSRKEDIIVGILSKIERKKTWNPAKHNKIITLLGRVKLDFTGFEIPVQEKGSSIASLFFRSL